MALENAFQRLCAELQGLIEALESLLITIREDGPRADDFALVDHLADPAEDLTQRLREALNTARAGLKAAGHPLDGDAARHALINCHEQCQAIVVSFASTIASFHRLREVSALQSHRTRGVAGWAGTVMRSIESIQRRFFELSESLLRCWEDFTERMGTTSVSVHSTNIGQHLEVPAEGHAIDRAT